MYNVNFLAVIDDSTKHVHFSSTAFPRPGSVIVCLRSTNTSRHQTILHTTKFTYTLRDYREAVEGVLRHVNEGLPLRSDVIPAMESPEEVSELDRVLTLAVQGVQWNLTLEGEEEEGNRTGGTHV